MAHTLLPPRPPNYQTSRAVRAGISLAYSTTSNKRGLESLWYAPYTHVFTDMAGPYDGHILVNPQASLHIPSLVARELRLRQFFEDKGFDWDAEDTGGVQLGTNNAGVRVATPGDNLGPEVRRSTRLLTLQEKAAADEAKQALALKADLETLKAKLYDDQLESYEKENPFIVKKDLDFIERSYDPNISSTTAPSEHDVKAEDEDPDFVLVHIAAVELPEPQSEKQRIHHEHRVGIKVFHQCSVLIGEVKTPPTRSAATGHDQGDLPIVIQIQEAQNDLLEYCAAHFLREPASESVIAFAAAGPYWRWAVVSRGDVPELNWLKKTVFLDQNQRVVAFHAKFGAPFFRLGWPESDKELTEINQNHIHSRVNDPVHTPPAPSLDDSDDSGDGDDED